MRLALVLAAAGMSVAVGPAFSQGPAADPASGPAVDDAYRAKCEAKAPKELCACVIQVANADMNQPSDRQIFFDFMMGEVDKAKAARDAYELERKQKLNFALQRADVRLGEQCDRLKPQQPAAK